MTKLMTTLVAVALMIGLVQPVGGATDVRRAVVGGVGLAGGALEPSWVVPPHARDSRLGASYAAKRANPAVWWVIRIALQATKKRAASIVVKRATYEKAKEAALRVAMRELEKELEELYVEGGQKLLKFNKRNFRENVRRRTHWSEDNIKGYDAHHTLPQMFKAEFSLTGLNIHNPVFGHWWCEQAHRKHAKAFNDAWGRWLEPRVSKMKKTKKWRMRVERKRLAMVSNPDWAATYQCPK